MVNRYVVHVDVAHALNIPEGEGSKNGLSVTYLGLDLEVTLPDVNVSQSVSAIVVHSPPEQDEDEAEDEGDQISCQESCKTWPLVTERY